MSEIAISVENISKFYKLYDRHIDRLKEAIHPFGKKYHHNFYALKNVSFKVKKGETVGIIGRNGSGKSTLLQIIAEVLTQSSGQVIVNGTISALLELGAGFNPELTGVENIYFSGMLMGFSKEEIDTKLDDILSFADIGEFVYQPMKIYSSGMYVRLTFAVAVNVDPDILIVDEALAVGDISFQAKCYKKFSQFQKEGKSILFVTHSLDSVIRYCNKAIVLDNGEKIVETNPKEAVDVYKKLMVDCYQADDKNKNNQMGEKQLYAAPFKDKFSINPNALSYGNMNAVIEDFGIFDGGNNPVQNFFSNDMFYIKMKIKFNKRIENPIFAYTIKDIKGLEITGTNTHYSNIDTGVFDEGDIVLVEFSQVLNMQSGNYTLSLGCTKYKAEGFTVFHRLYDILLFEVTSEVKMVGFYDLKSSVKFYKINLSQSG